jgi:hypothetical protein
LASPADGIKDELTDLLASIMNQSDWNSISYGFHSRNGISMEKKGKIGYSGF